MLFGDHENDVLPACRFPPAYRSAKERKECILKSPRRLLLVEDDPNDAELLRRRLLTEWPQGELVVVATEADLKAALKKNKFDLILCDYCLPGYSGLAALQLAREQVPDVPFIFVSGGIGDGVAVESLKAGATDYVLKDRLARLAPAIRRALKEKEERTRREQAEARMRSGQARLARLNKDLLRTNQEIQNFYHTLSHELKTPLTSAREFIAIVMDGLAGPLNETQSEYLAIAKESCNQLQVCINDLLDATRLETGKLTLELKPVALGSLVQRVVTTMNPRAAQKKIALRQDVQPNLPEAPMDEHRITQVITNLVNNAIKYTLAGGQILVKAIQAPGHPELLEVSVTDTGCGISKQDQDRIFDRLYQVKAGDATTDQGIGLGLYLCRELVQLHGGSIRVESALGQGSVFSFVLPTSPASLHSNLLVIDDDLEVLEMMRHLLDAEDYNVRTARDGEEGLREMRRHPPDIVMLDLALPNLSGPATLKEIRSQWGLVPVIVHTGLAEGDLMRQALSYSPFTLLLKPCAPDQILETIRKARRAGDTALWKRNHYGLQKPYFQ